MEKTCLCHLLKTASDTDIRAAIIMAFPRDVYEAIKDD